tara:strand:+ start:4375 stop:5202 length:828 start_codon:yes stop_codon:yes gene_type:complete
MLVNPTKILNFVYKTVMIGMPQVLYNPMGNIPLCIPITIDPFSTYINYKLNNENVNALNTYVSHYNSSLKLVPIKLYENGDPDYFLSINIYNLSSPIFFSSDTVTRCEINTYIMDDHGTKGTLILDYLTNGLSMDPISIFKPQEYLKKVQFLKIDDKFDIKSKSKIAEVDLDIEFKEGNIYSDTLSNELIEYTDNVFYKDGILDKIYYDNTLVNAIIKKACVTKKKFVYKSIVFDKPDSVFYFKNDIHFVGSMWNNLYKIKRFRPLSHGITRSMD